MTLFWPKKLKTGKPMGEASLVGENQVLTYSHAVFEMLVNHSHDYAEWAVE